MTRETKTINIGANKFEFYTYLTGRESLAIQNQLLSKIQISSKGGIEEMDKISADFLINQRTEQLKVLLVSVNDEKADPFEKALDLSVSDFDELLKVSDEICKTDKKKLEI